MNSIFCGVNAFEISISSLSPLYNFLVLVFMVRTVPVETSYACSRIGSSFSSRTTFPAASVFFTQFFRSKPIPPVTSTVVKKIGEIPFVPPTIGAKLTNGTYGLACFPVQSATLFTPDIRDEPTPIVPFSAINITDLSGCCACKALISSCACGVIIHLPCNSRSERECAWFPGDNKSVEISPIPAM